MYSSSSSAYSAVRARYRRYPMMFGIAVIVVVIILIIYFSAKKSKQGYVPYRMRQERYGAERYSGGADPFGKGNEFPDPIHRVPRWYDPSYGQ